MEKGIRFIGNGQAPVHRYWEEILNDYIRTKKFDINLILTHRFPLEEMDQLYAKFDKRVPGLLKTFVETKFSGTCSRSTYRSAQRGLQPRCREASFAFLTIQPVTPSYNHLLPI